MPELPDLVLIEKRLNQSLPGEEIQGALVKQPVVIRNQTGRPFEEAVTGSVFGRVERRGPFLRFSLSDGGGADASVRRELVIHPMLAGRFAFENAEHKPKKSGLCFSLETGAGTLHYLDAKKMGKVYLLPPERFELVPRYNDQGLELLSEDFTLAAFRQLIDKSRKQVRVFLMDQTILSAIGNAYADEILFEARLHPKTFCYQLEEEQRDALFAAIREILDWGIRAVEVADRPLEDKVRDHMRVRNRKDEPCPECGVKIRRASVLGFDTFFCPECQPAGRSQFIDWRGTGKKES